MAIFYPTFHGKACGCKLELKVVNPESNRLSEHYAGKFLKKCEFHSAMPDEQAFKDIDDTQFEIGRVEREKEEADKLAAEAEQK